mgnify:CR=1 FL=1
MTILDVNNLLFDWYTNNSTFKMDRDFKKIVPIYEDEDEVKKTIELALDQLIEANLILPCKEKEYYILTKPFSAYQQTLEINSWVSAYVASQINSRIFLIFHPTQARERSSMRFLISGTLIHR